MLTLLLPLTISTLSILLATQITAGRLKQPPVRTDRLRPENPFFAKSERQRLVGEGRMALILKPLVMTVLRYCTWNFR